MLRSIFFAGTRCPPASMSQALNIRSGMSPLMAYNSEKLAMANSTKASHGWTKKSAANAGGGEGTIGRWHIPHQGAERPAAAAKGLDFEGLEGRGDTDRHDVIARRRRRQAMFIPASQTHDLI
jgi:hypothetical protein